MFEELERNGNKKKRSLFTCLSYVLKSEECPTSSSIVCVRASCTHRLVSRHALPFY